MDTCILHLDVANAVPAISTIQQPTEAVLRVFVFTVVGCDIDSRAPRESEGVTGVKIPVYSIGLVRFIRAAGVP